MLSFIRGAPRAAENVPRSPRDELEWLARAWVLGDTDAARTLVAAVGGTVLGAVRMVLGPRHGDIEDVAQDAVIGFLEGLRRFRGECSVAHFAGRVAVLTAMAARRRQRTRDRWVVADGVEAEGVPDCDETSPLARLEASRRRHAIRRLLDELPDPLAETMALHFMLGHTAQEIAAAAQVPVNTVWSRLRIGKERLHETLANDPNWSEELSLTECG